MDEGSTNTSCYYKHIPFTLMNICFGGSCSIIKCLLNVHVDETNVFIHRNHGNKVKALYTSVPDILPLTGCCS